MPFIACVTDQTAHGAPICSPGSNTKIFFNNIPFTTLGGTGPVHPLPHIIPLPNIIISPNQAKILINNIPFAVLGAACSCGDVVVGSPVNTKINIG